MRTRQEMNPLGECLAQKVEGWEARTESFRGGKGRSLINR
jgi:hypothetical protein